MTEQQDQSCNGHGRTKTKRPRKGCNHQANDQEKPTNNQQNIFARRAHQTPNEWPETTFNLWEVVVSQSAPFCLAPFDENLYEGQNKGRSLGAERSYKPLPQTAHVFMSLYAAVIPARRHQYVSYALPCPGQRVSFPTADFPIASE